MKIALIGKVSSGKTSFLNALVCKLVGRVSLLRETTECIEYSFGNHIILDFPGLNDSDDENNNFMELFRERVVECQLVLYITDCRKAFITESERTLFNLIEGVVEKQYMLGNYCKVKIIANKYDDYDEEIEQLLSSVECYKISSHNLLMERLITNDMSIHIPEYFKKEFKKIMINAGIRCNIKTHINFTGVQLCVFASPGDWDGLLNMIELYASEIDNNVNIMAYKIVDDLIHIDNLDLTRDQLHLLYKMYQLCSDHKEEIDNIINDQLATMTVTSTNHRATQSTPNSVKKTLTTYYELTGTICISRLNNLSYKLYVAMQEHNKEYMYKFLRIFPGAIKPTHNYSYYNIKYAKYVEFNVNDCDWEWYNYLIKLHNATPDQIKRKIVSDDTFLPHIKKEYNVEILYNVMYQQSILTFTDFDIGEL